MTNPAGILRNVPCAPFCESPPISKNLSFVGGSSFDGPESAAIAAVTVNAPAKPTATDLVTLIFSLLLQRWSRHRRDPDFLHAPKEVDYGGAYLRSTFLLGPMSATRQHHRLPELWNQCRLLRKGRRKSGGDKIALPPPVKRGNG